MKYYFILLFLLLNYFTLSNAAVYYVDSGASTNTQSGSSWSTAFKNLSIALKKVSSGDAIFIAEGIYKPTTGSDRYATFTVPNNLKIYGGFAGTEATPWDRPSPLLSTYLDGDIGVSGLSTDNVYHVITFDDNLYLDGVIIRNGYANGANFYSYGGGLFQYTNESKAPSSSFGSTLLSVTVINNTACQGGGLYSFGSRQITLNKTVFMYNNAIEGTYNGGTGGGAHVSYNSDLYIYSSEFYKNSAYYRGGAIYSDYASDLYIKSTYFHDNEAYKYNGSNGGAIFGEDRNSQYGGTYHNIISCNFTNNKASGYGGAIMWYNALSGNVTSSKFYSNQALLGGGAIELWDVSTTTNLNDIKTKNTFINNSPGNITSKNTTEVSNYTTNVVNINTYLNTLYDKKQNDIDNTTASIKIIYVDSSKTGGTLDGSSWNKAYNNLQTAINSAKNYDNNEVWVKKGTYIPTSNPDNEKVGNCNAFLIQSNVKLYGGFNGNETKKSQRNWKNYLTYLNGLNNNVLSANVLIGGQNTLLDGFIIINGYATNEDYRRRLQVEDNTNHATEDLVRSEVRTASGGGIHINGSDMEINNCIFYHNWGKGGGAISSVGENTLIVKNTAFLSNAASLRGGAINCNVGCSLYCYDCLFIDNGCTSKGGGLYFDFSSYGYFNNSQFYNNYAYESGGAMALDGGGHVIMENSIINNNTATMCSGGLYSGSHNPLEAQYYVLNNINITNNTCQYSNENIYLWNDVYSIINNYTYNDKTLITTASPTTKSPTSKPTTKSPSLTTKSPSSNSNLSLSNSLNLNIIIYQLYLCLLILLINF